jgi:MobA-like NTP transferase domain
MADGALRALCASKADGVLVVTRERKIMNLADELGAEIVEESDVRGHNAAATLGIRRALQRGAGRVLLAAGDCPLLTTEEIDALLDRHSGDGVVILADRHAAQGPTGCCSPRPPRSRRRSGSAAASATPSWPTTAGRRGSSRRSRRSPMTSTPPTTSLPRTLSAEAISRPAGDRFRRRRPRC